MAMVQSRLPVEMRWHDLGSPSLFLGGNPNMAVSGPIVAQGLAGPNQILLKTA